MRHPEVIVVGAGLAGLSCALRLHRAGVEVQLLEAQEEAGGRVRTLRRDGYQLDLGFQVLLEAYPEAQDIFDYESLQLCRFQPGALVRVDRRMERMLDPFRNQSEILSAALASVGGLLDKLRIAQLREYCLSHDENQLLSGAERTALAELRARGFSDELLERFLRPFLGGVLFDRELLTSSRMLLFVWRMFALGAACLPLRGMDSLPRQLCAALPIASVRSLARVLSIEAPVGRSPAKVRLERGEELEAQALVLATPMDETERLLGRESRRAWQSTVCLYYSAERDPVGEALLVLNGEGRGPINHLCVPSTVAPSYAPPGKALISANVVGLPKMPPAELERAVRAQLVEWFGPLAQEFQHLQTFALPHALPAQPVGSMQPPSRPVRLAKGLYVAGDHLENASIHGALAAGRRASAALLRDRGAALVEAQP